MSQKKPSQHFAIILDLNQKQELPDLNYKIRGEFLCIKVSFSGLDISVNSFIVGINPLKFKRLEVTANARVIYLAGNLTVGLILLLNTM